MYILTKMNECSCCLPAQSYVFTEILPHNASHTHCNTPGWMEVAAVRMQTHTYSNKSQHTLRQTDCNKHTRTATYSRR